MTGYGSAEEELTRYGDLGRELTTCSRPRSVNRLMKRADWHWLSRRGEWIWKSKRTVNWILRHRGIAWRSMRRTDRILKPRMRDEWIWWLGKGGD